ncbi:MAG: molybdopterin-dependent oxidoreductase [Melioribacteraceae bacterium]|nr:molybdopterin-dependent oxidoreductase [Melioribacteraceae bacterium]
MKNFDAVSHIKGKSIYIDDYPLPEGTLHAVVFDSKIAHGKIVNLSLEKAKVSKGVSAILTAKDIPSENQIGGIIEDETLLAEDEVHFIGEPIAIVLADSVTNARKAVKEIEIEFEELPIITNPREAFSKNSLIAPPVTFSSGNVSDAWNNCDTIIDGTIDSGGQEHLYLETQGAISIPIEGNKIKIISSTQSPTGVQRKAAKVLGVPMHQVEVDVLRLGGAFGGKEDQATVWGVLSALAAFILDKPIKLVLSREDDLRMTGKRHPYSSDYKMGLTKDGKILAYEVTFYQNAGAVADLSTAVLDRTLFHATNCYYIPNVKATGISCKTNLPPNTAFRGFGGPQGMFVIEAAIVKAASALGLQAYDIQRINLLKNNDLFYYGQKVENSQAISSWDSAVNLFNSKELIEKKNKFNKNNSLFKKGISFMPICFGISFTSSFLNQASALVHVYTDGSVGISTGAVEMGQGVNAKIATAASKIFSIDITKVKVESTNTTRAANTSPTAASSAADMNGNATILACKQILNRLIDFARTELNASEEDDIKIENEKVFINGEASNLIWSDLISKAYFGRISLSAQAYYRTPEIYFDRDINKGSPFAYHVYGTAISTVTLDVIRGTYKFDSVKIMHDFGKSLNRNIDIGQVEGALVQGIGWMTIEEIRHSANGKLLANTLSTYKVPDIYSIPKEIEVKFLENSENRFGPFNSKAIGEPPFMYGIGAYFAILDAMNSVRPNKEFEISAPLTPEKVLLALYS